LTTLLLETGIFSWVTSLFDHDTLLKLFIIVIIYEIENDKIFIPNEDTESPVLLQAS